MIIHSARINVHHKITVSFINLFCKISHAMLSNLFKFQILYYFYYHIYIDATNLIRKYSLYEIFIITTKPLMLISDIIKNKL